MRRIILAFAMTAFAILPATAGAATIPATPSTFASAVSSAQPGDTVSLASGNYGTWSGTNKAITVKAADGATPTMKAAFNTGDAGFTLDGISGFGGDIENDAHDITVKNSVTSSTLAMPGDRSGPVVFDNVRFNSNVGCSSGCLPSLWIGAGGTAHHTKIRVQNSEFTNSPGDGIQAGSAFTIVDSNLHVSNPTCGPCHTDNIQLYSGQAQDGVGSTILRNYIHDDTNSNESDGIVQFDGGGGNDVEDNVISNMGLFGMDFGGDRSSKIIHNTVVTRRTGIDMTSKAGQTSTGYTLKDNIANSVSMSGSTPAVFTNNMIGNGASSPNFGGTPVFVGGSSPTTYAGFALAASSPGKGRASDGLDVGARFGSTPPPTDTDGDGVPDSQDNCPTQPGPASNQGCPVTPPTDHQPVAAFTVSPASPAPGTVVRFDGTGSTCDDTPCTYVWEDDGSDGAGGTQYPLGSGSTLDFMFQNAGDKHVRLTVTDTDGDTNSTVQTVTVATIPNPPGDACDQACVDAYEARITDLETQLAAETLRADDAEALAASRLDMIHERDATITALQGTLADIHDLSAP